MHKKVLDLIQAQDTKQLDNLISKELVVNSGQFASSVIQISNAMKVDSFSITDEYYIINKYMADDTVKTDAKGDEAHNLIYPGVTREMYAVFYVPKNDTPNKWMVTMLYNKFDYGWKLSHLTMQPYMMNGKTAQQLYRSAQQEYKNGYLINAFNDARMSYSCMHPSRMYRYNNEQEVFRFFSKVQQEAIQKFKMPMIFKQVATHPGIIGFYNRSINEGNFPIISYLTRVNLKDAAAIRKENAEIQEHIGELMPGVDQHKKYLYYQIYNTPPSREQNIRSLEIIDTLR